MEMERLKREKSVMMVLATMKKMVRKTVPTAVMAVRIRMKMKAEGRNCATGPRFHLSMPAVNG